METNRLVLQIRGTSPDKPDIKFDGFLEELEAVRKALIETDRVVSKGQSVYYVVTSTEDTPVTLILEAIPRENAGPDNSTAIMSKFVTSWALIAKGEAPADFDHDAFRAFREMADLLIQNQLMELVISNNGNIVHVPAGVSQNIDAFASPAHSETGSATGFLRDVRAFGGQTAFTVFPTSGRPPVPCMSAAALHSQVVAATDRYVKVFGQLRYGAGTAEPYEMVVQQIEVYPSEEVLPTLKDLWGIASGALDDKPSEEVVRDQRSAW